MISKQLLGFSTGTFEATGLTLNERIAFLHDLGCTALQLGYVKNERVAQEPIADIDIALLENFSWVSFHAPGSRWKYKRDDPGTQKLLQDIEVLHLKHPIDLVIFHPDSLDDLSVLDGYSFPIGIENMDDRKRSFQDAATLRSIFATHPHWKFVLDVHHAFLIDPEKRANELLSAFRDRLAEIHVSGYHDGHVPLYETQQDVMLDLIRGLDTPIILEGKTANLEAMKQEYQYVQSRLHG